MSALIISRIKMMPTFPELISLIIHTLNIVAVMSKVNRWYEIHSG
jgi:hypothetical protein